MIFTDPSSGAVVRAVSVVGGEASEPKSTRKGHPYACRVDVAEQEGLQVCLRTRSLFVINFVVGQPWDEQGSSRAVLRNLNL